MPRKDGTGPQGKGAGTGRGSGGCKTGKTGRDSGQGRSRGDKRVKGRNQGERGKNS